MPLHQHPHHSVLSGPSADIVVKRDGVLILLLGLVARTARHKNENRAIVAAFLGGKDIDDVLWIGTNETSRAMLIPG